MVLAGALAPQSNSPQLFALADKVAHVGAFLILYIIGSQAYPAHIPRLIIALIFLGGAIEFAQGYTSTRSQEVVDFYADLLGVACGSFIHWLYQKLR